MKSIKKHLFLILPIAVLFIGSCNNKNSNNEQEKIKEEVNLTLPGLKTEDTEFDTLSMVFHLALGDLVGNMRLRGKDDKQRTVLYAGLDYQGAWTRDASISVWFGLPFLSPTIAKNTLLEVLSKDKNGAFDQIGGQYWDKVIWLTGAWRYYLITGDEEFLKLAYKVGEKSLNELQNEEYDDSLNLFRGPAVYGDGISAYEDIYIKTGEYDGKLWLSNIDKWAQANPDLKYPKGGGMPMLTLSTNAVYFNAFNIMAEMSKILKTGKEVEFKKDADNIQKGLNQTLWSDSLGFYKYYADPFGGSNHQESLGLSFAILFGLSNQEQTKSILKNAYVSPYGIPCVWPGFSRYDTKKGDMGRHAGTVWTHIQGFWSIAAAQNKNLEVMENEIMTQTRQAYKSKQFKEIYHPFTGEEYGGLQEDGFVKDSVRLWKSTDRQTWGASAYLGSIFYGLLGIEPTINGLLIEPKFFRSFPNCRIENLKYRNAIIDIVIHGSGTQIETFKVNQETLKDHLIPSSATGIQNVEIFLK